jgi:WD40 repeat protein
MVSSPWCSSIAISPTGNYVLVGFENATVRFFDASGSEQPREERLHIRQHQECRGCPSIDTLSFSHDGLVLLASTRSSKNGLIQIYCWPFPFVDFQELPTCRYHVPLHESEDNGVSSVIFQSPAAGSAESLVCITTWTQSGVPVLVQPKGGYQSPIRSLQSSSTGGGGSSHQGKLGSRIQCAAFSPSGRGLALVNDKGHVYRIVSLNAMPMDIRRIATSKELTTRSDSFAMAFVSVPDEAEIEAIVLVWADSSKAIACVKSISITSSVSSLIRSLTASSI